jgi:uncharacterized membrane protein YdjX (TVP38/TMEM64 family)
VPKVDEPTPAPGERPRDERGPGRSRWILRVSVAGLVVGLLVVANALGLFRHLGEPAKMAAAIAGLGGWGYAAFVLAYALIEPFGLPGTVFIMAAPLVWPWPLAFALSMVGTMAASVVGFFVARFVARDWVTPRIPARFRRYEKQLAERGFATVFTLRIIFWMAPLLHAFLGISPVSFTTYFWGSLAGYVVPLLAVSFYGPRVFAAARAIPLSVWAVAAGVAVVVGAALLIGARARRDVRARSSLP